MKNINEIEKDQLEYGKDINSILVEEKTEAVLKKKKENKRNTPQLSCTLDQRSIDFLKDMTLFYSMKKRRVFNFSKTLRIILKYARDMEHELQTYI